MALSDYKITDNAVSTKGVVAAPDKLTGTANQNKMIFDRLIREAVKGLYNGLIDALAGSGGAAGIGLDAEGVEAETVAGGMAELAAALATMATRAYVDGRYVTAGQKSGTTLGSRSTAEGYRATASGAVSHAEGSGATASGATSHAEGLETTAGGEISHAEGWGASAEGYAAHAEGKSSSASGWYAHAEGSGTTASGEIAHAEGSGTTASGEIAHAEGRGTVANHKSQHVFGEYNVADDSAAYGIYRGNYVEIVGNGTADNARSNARTLDWSGNETLAGKLTLGTAPTNDADAATKKYVDDGLSAKQNTLTFDTTPTANSTNPVTSGGVKTALDAKHDIFHCTYGTTTYAEITAALAAGKLPVCAVYDEEEETSVVYPYTDSYNDMLDMATVYRFQLAYRDADGGVVIKGLKCRHTDEWDTFEASLQDKLTFDTTPTANSTKPVTSAGIKTALDAKQNTLTFDSSPTSGSNNPVKSSGIKNAIDDSKPIVITRNGMSVASACNAAHSGLLQGRSVYVEIITYRSGGVADTLRLYLTNEVMRASDHAYYFGSFVDGTLYGIKLSRSSGWGELTEIPLGGA